VILVAKPRISVSGNVRKPNSKRSISRQSRQVAWVKTKLGEENSVDDTSNAFEAVEQLEGLCEERIEFSDQLILLSQRERRNLDRS
jgi:hypothetical protein